MKLVVCRRACYFSRSWLVVRDMTDTREEHFSFIIIPSKGFFGEPSVEVWGTVEEEESE